MAYWCRSKAHKRNVDWGWEGGSVSTIKWVQWYNTHVISQCGGDMPAILVMRGRDCRLWSSLASSSRQLVKSRFCERSYLKKLRWEMEEATWYWPLAFRCVSKDMPTCIYLLQNARVSVCASVTVKQKSIPYFIIFLKYVLKVKKKQHYGMWKGGGSAFKSQCCFLQHTWVWFPALTLGCLKTSVTVTQDFLSSSGIHGY